MDRHLFFLDIGDSSGDGHGIVDRFLLSSSKSSNEIKVALIDARFFGIDLADICSNYEDSYLNKETLDKLKKIGYTYINSTEECVTPREFVDLYIYVVKHFCKGIEIEILDIPFLNNSNLGYGLYNF